MSIAGIDLGTSTFVYDKKNELTKKDGFGGAGDYGHDASGIKTSVKDP